MAWINGIFSTVRSHLLGGLFSIVRNRLVGNNKSSSFVVGLIDQHFLLRLLTPQDFQTGIDPLDEFVLSIGQAFVARVNNIREFTGRVVVGTEFALAPNLVNEWTVKMIPTQDNFVTSIPRLLPCSPSP
jgi:hypothetical protein